MILHNQAFAIARIDRKLSIAVQFVRFTPNNIIRNGLHPYLNHGDLLK